MVRLHGFQSTPPVKAATRFRKEAERENIISIHAAREGGDGCKFTVTITKGISIHAAREGGDIQAEFPIVTFKVFQSTPPVKAATIT